MKERPSNWSRPWLAMWAAAACATVSLAFALPPRTWAVAAALLFGVPEAFALLRRGDRYPPLTYVTAHYLPRWLTVTLIGFLAGSIGASWLGFHRRWLLGALMALVVWAQDHFDITYETRADWSTDARHTSG